MELISSKHLDWELLKRSFIAEFLNFLEGCSHVLVSKHGAWNLVLLHQAAGWASPSGEEPLLALASCC